MDAQDFKEMRTRLGSQKAVAQELEIGESTIQSYESGRAPIPRTVELAIDALIRRRGEEAASTRVRFKDSAARYATALASQQHDNMAFIWTNEIAPLIAAADADAHVELRLIVQNTIDTVVRPWRVYNAALKNRGTLVKFRNDLPAGDYARQGLDEILKELG